MEDVNKGTAVLMRDIIESERTDAFFGKGTEKLIKEAERKGVDIIVGRFYKKPYMDE